MVEPSRSEQTRIQILQIAYQLFLQHGYHATSMRQIATQAGISLGGIYNHFSSKEELFEAVFISHHPFIEVLPALLAAQGETPEELVRDAASRMLCELEKRPDFLRLLFIEIIEFNNTHTHNLVLQIIPPEQKRIDRFLEAYHHKFRPIPRPILFRSFLGMFFSYYITGIILSDEIEMIRPFREDAFNYFVDIYLHGILSGDEV